MPVACADQPIRERGDDVRRRAHREPHPQRAVLGEVGGDLGAGVAGADDEHVATGVRSAVAVVAGDHDLPGEAVDAGPVGGHRGVGVAGGDDDVGGLDGGAVVEVDHPARPARRCPTTRPGRRRDRRGSRPTRAAAAAGGGRHTPRGSARRRRGRPTGRTVAGWGSRAAPTSGAGCAGGAGRSGGATSWRRAGTGRRRGCRHPWTPSAAAAASPPGPAPTTTTSTCVTERRLPGGRRSARDRPDATA